MGYKVVQRIAISIALALAAALPLALAACGASGEKAVHDAVTKELESLKQLDDKALDQILGTAVASADYTQFGVKDREFFEAWMNGFEYSVGDVTVNGNTAAVEVTITYKPMSAIIARFQNEITRFGFDGTTATMTQEELSKETGRILLDSCRSTPTATTSISLSYVKNGNTWEPGPAFNSELRKPLLD